MQLHYSMCTSEGVQVHENFEHAFYKNFAEEIRRLSVDLSPISGPNSPVRSIRHGSLVRIPDHLHSEPLSAVSTKPPFYIPPLQLGRPVVTPPPMSPRSLQTPTMSEAPIRQTPLQRNLAHLARHGMHGVSSGPGDTTNSDSISAGSPHGSFVNVGSGVPAASISGTSMGASTFGNSLGSLRGRISRFGSLNFGRRD